MSLKTSPILALVCLLPLSSFEAVQSVSPSEGSEGIQTALDELPAGSEVVLGEGKYVIHKPIMISKDGQTLRGSGASTVLFLADGANCPVVVLGSFAAPGKNLIKGVRLLNLLIDGNRKSQQREIYRFLPEGAGVYNNGVCVWGADEAAVEHVVCSHCRSGGLVTSARTRRLTVRDYAAFDNQFDGLACYATEDSQFSHLDLHDNLAAGVSLDLSFNHNVIRDARLADNDLGIFMRQSRDNIFEDVTIKKSRHQGIFMAEAGVRTATGWRLLPGSACTGNLFSELSISNCGGTAFRVNDAGCSNNTLSDGRFSDNAEGGLSQVLPNLLIVRQTVESAQPSVPSAVMPVSHHQLTQGSDTQTATKPL